MLISSFIAGNISTITFVQDTMEEMIMGYFKHASDHGLPQQARHKTKKREKIIKNTTQSPLSLWKIKNIYYVFL